MSPGGLCLSLVAILAASLACAAEAPRTVASAKLETLSFADLAGWAGDDHAAAFATFRRTCAAILADHPAVPATGDDLRAVCAAASTAGAASDAKGFFERHFEPVRIVPPSAHGFLTGYFEPEYEGALAPDPAYPIPLLARPDDLVSIAADEALPGVDPALRAARRTGEGYEAYPDRAAIEDGALGGLAKPIVYLRDAVDAMIVHVQGSARIRLPDGTVVRVAYAGKNGQPFTAVGRLIVQAGHVPLGEMNLERMTGWLKANPERARELMRQNRSYIFFRLAHELDPNDGPIGGAGLPLTPGRSLAIDAKLWSYGLPFWLEGELPVPGGGSEPLARLMIAQDTGSAIVGPARGDLFTGSGPEAGTRAGLIRHPIRFVVLRPKRPHP